MKIVLILTKRIEDSIVLKLFLLIIINIISYCNEIIMLFKRRNYELIRELEKEF